MPSLDVVVSVYRETGAPALYAALATIHGRAPLRLAVFLHDGNANPTIAWSPPANVTGGGALAHNRAHHTHDRIFIADSAGKLRNCAGTTCERPACAARQCPLAPAGGAAAALRQVWDVPTPFPKVVLAIPNLSDEASAYLLYISRQYFGGDHTAAGGGAGKIFRGRRPPRVAFLHAHTASWHNLWPPIEAALSSDGDSSGVAYKNLNVPPPDTSVVATGAAGRRRAVIRSRAAGSFWDDLCVSDGGFLCSAPTARSRRWLAGPQMRDALSARMGKGAAPGQPLTKADFYRTADRRLCVKDRFGKAAAIRNGWEGWTRSRWPGHLRMDCCAQFVVAYAALEARGARFWHDLASLSLDPVASAGVPWEYLWRGVLAGSDAELGDDCAGNRTVRERS